MFDKTNPIYCAVRSYIISGVVRTDGVSQEVALERGQQLLDMLMSRVGEEVVKHDVPVNEPAWLDRPVRLDYRLLKPQFLDYTWRQMGEGSEDGGRHNMLRWLGRRGRTSYDKDVARYFNNLPTVSITTMNRALIVLRQAFGEGPEDL
jgi:hypothetical protein